MADHSAHDLSQLPVTGITRVRIAETLTKQNDVLAVEEPLEIVVGCHGKNAFTLTITMRTPGNDLELAAGFLFAEGIIKNKTDIEYIGINKESANPANSIRVVLSAHLDFEPDRLQRYFFTNSSCGVCGKTSIQALEMMHQPALIPAHPKISATALKQLPDRLRKRQEQFSATGSMHSAALFSREGQLLMLREDVGRHNAMDKLIGAVLLDNKLPMLQNNLVLVSGRASFELVQKALMADIPVLVSIGAPTSLAFQLASRHGMTLAGFLKADSFNIYCSSERII